MVCYKCARRLSVGSQVIANTFFKDKKRQQIRQQYLDKKWAVFVNKLQKAIHEICACLIDCTICILYL